MKKTEIPNFARESMAGWDLLNQRKHYSADAMDSTTCTHNHLIGKCGINCPVYQREDCPIQDEIDEAVETERK